MTTILVVEDEKAISRIIVDNLIFEGYEVLAAADGPAGLELALSDRADLILLDIMLPGGLNGYDICRQMREQGLTTPVIMLTARSEEVDKITGFELGADDYVTKPVGVRELLARVKAVLRRAQPVEETSTSPDLLEFANGHAHIDFSRFETRVDDQPVHLSPKAYGVLKLLWQSQGRAVSRSEILGEVWGYDVYPTTRTVDNHIAELRAALEPDPSAPRYILTVHGVGYRFALEKSD